MKYFGILFIAFIFSVLPLSAQSAEKELASAALFGEGSAIIARLEMRIAAPGSEKNREIELMLDFSGSKKKVLARIVSPSFLSGMKFLKIREPGKPDAQWLRTSSGIRRLGESNKSEPVFGSTFTIEDFGSVDSSGYTIDFTPLKDRGFDKAIRASPKSAANFLEKIIWVNQKTQLVTAIEYLGEQGKVLKRYEVTKFSQKQDRPIEAQMHDIQSDMTTYLRIISIETKGSLPERYFNPGVL